MTAGGIDAGVGGPNNDCVAPPDGCPIEDCVSTDCAACVRELCAPLTEAQMITVSGRTLMCPGQ